MEPKYTRHCEPQARQSHAQWREALEIAAWPKVPTVGAIAPRNDGFLKIF